MKTIYTQKKEEIYVDDEDYDFLNIFTWRIVKGYAVSSILLHRFIVKCPKDLEVHHINSNPLDNRRNNLQIMTKSENLLLRNKSCDIDINVSFNELVYKNEKIFVDECDKELFQKFTWHIKKYGYIYTNVRMHRLILLEKQNENTVVDHIDGNRSNNTKNNLRIVTKKQNSQNRRKSTTNKIGLKGVTEENGYFRASVHKNGNYCRIGSFVNPVEAAYAYREEEKKFEVYRSDEEFENEISIFLSKNPIHKKEIYDFKTKRSHSSVKKPPKNLNISWGIYKEGRKYVSRFAYGKKKHYNGKYDCLLEALEVTRKKELEIKGSDIRTQEEYEKEFSRLREQIKIK